MECNKLTYVTHLTSHYSGGSKPNFPLNTHHFIPIWTHKNNQKHTNDSQNVTNSSQCVLYVIQVQKIEKQVKTDKFHNKCHFQSLEFYKMSKLVPKCFKWNKSQLKSLGIQKCSQNIPG